MANRSFLPPLGFLEVDVVGLFSKVTIGAAGAVSASSGKGILSVVHGTAGKYTITLSDRYNLFLSGAVTPLDAAVDDPTAAGLAVKIFSEAVNNATPTLVIQFYKTSDGTAVDPTAGTLVYTTMWLRNSSVS